MSNCFDLPRPRTCGKDFAGLHAPDGQAEHDDNYSQDQVVRDAALDGHF